MAQVLPFRAWRYAPGRALPDEVLTQPYDKITPAMQAAYHEKSPFNLVRLELGRSAPGDNAADNVYSRAKAFLDGLRGEGVMAQDPEPTLYVYQQTFRLPVSGTGAELTRRGFIALGRLHEYSERVVFRHEQTLAKPKADRVNLLRATRLQTGQLFMLYSDPSRQISAALQTSGSPETELTDEYGVTHRLWRIADAGVIGKVQQGMAEKQLIIADGHHRYETALAYRTERRAQAGDRSAKDAPYEFAMMTFVNMDDPELVILPTHRVVHGLNGFSAPEFLEAAEEYFNIAPHEISPRTLDSGSMNVCLRNGQAFSFSPKREPVAAALPRLSDAQRDLDVTVLHDVLLDRLLGVTPEEVRNQEHIRYYRSAGEALDQLRGNHADLAVLLNPVTIEQMKRVAFAGDVMPQKSTDFYPKLLSGIANYALD